MHQPPLILVIDDENDFLEITSAALKAGGFAVETVNNVADSFKKAQEVSPDLIVLDINMPGINGTEALLDFLSNPATKNFKIVFFTNMTLPWPGIKGDPEKFAQSLGAIGLLSKTKDLDNLVEKVKEILNQK